MDYSFPHVHARDIRSGAGNCVCGSGLPDAVHLKAASGIEIPNRSLDAGRADHRVRHAWRSADVVAGFLLVRSGRCGRGCRR